LIYARFTRWLKQNILSGIGIERTRS